MQRQTGIGRGDDVIVKTGNDTNEIARGKKTVKVQAVESSRLIQQPSSCLLYNK